MRTDVSIGITGVSRATTGGAGKRWGEILGFAPIKTGNGGGSTCPTAADPFIAAADGRGEGPSRADVAVRTPTPCARRPRRASWARAAT
jgi:hypothetical protein